MPEVEEQVSEATQPDAKQVASVEEPAESAEVSETSTTDNVDHEKPKRGGFQRRIERLGTSLRTAEQERDYWREQALQSAPKQEAPKETKKPKAEDFTGPNAVEDWLEARDAWVTEQATKKAIEEAEKRFQQERQRQESQKANQGWEERISQAREKYDDWDEVMADAAALRISPNDGMTNAITTSDLGPEIMYFLAHNPDDAKAISRLNPHAAAREIGRIEAYIAEIEAEGEESEKEEVTEPVITEAKVSAPPRPLRKSAPSSSGLSDDLPMEEWVKRREAQTRKR